MIALKYFPLAIPATLASIAGMSLVTGMQPLQSKAYLVPYNQAGGVTKAQALQLNHYAKPQSYEAMVTLLGHPNYRGEASDVYIVKDSAFNDGVMAPEKLTVYYELDHATYTHWIATGWEVQH